MTLHPALGAVAFVLIGTVSFNDRDSYQMTATWPGHQVQWRLKSGNLCVDLTQAIRLGEFDDVSSDATLSCVPKPGLFTPRSNCIAGFNCPKEGHRK